MRLAPKLIAIATVGLVGCGGSGGLAERSAGSRDEPPAVVADVPDCDAFAAALATASRIDGGDLASMREIVPQHVEALRVLEQNVPSDLVNDVRTLLDSAEHQKRIVEDPDFELDPDVGHLWEGYVEELAVERLNDWADRECPASISDGMLDSQDVMLCLPAGAWDTDVQEVFVRYQDVEGVQALTHRVEAVQLELDRFITDEARRSLFARFDDDPDIRVLEDTDTCV